MKMNYFLIALIFIISGSTPNFAASGDLDTTFGSGGFIYTMPWDKMAIQADDKIVITRIIRESNGSYIAIRRMNADSSPDYNFGMLDGVGFYQIPGYVSISALTVQSNGQILVTGVVSIGSTANYDDNPAKDDFYVLRLNSNGLADTGFGSNGLAVTDFSANRDTPTDVAVRPDGKIVVVGSAVFGNATKFAVARYNTNGTADTSFSGNGKMVTGWGENYNIARSVALLPNNKILVGGEAVLGGQDNFALAQFNNNGSLDNTFGTAGLVNTNFGVASAANRVSVQPDGKIVASGRDYNMARFNSNGTLDTSFGTGGKISAHLMSGTYQILYANDTALQSDGKIVVAADTYSQWVLYASIQRFNTSGAIDTSFGNGGIVIFGSALQFAHVGFQSTGKIIVSGQFGIARYLP